MKIPFQTILLASASIAVSVVTADADDEVARWIHKLQSDTPSEFRIAQVYLARPGCGALDELDQLAKTADERLKQRLKEVVALTLLNGVETRELERRRHLYAVAASEFKKARELADRLTEAVAKAKRENPDATQGVQWYLLDDEASALSEKLFQIHGWGIPALLHLTKSKYPFLKMMSLHMLLVTHAARIPSSALDRLKNDQTPVVRLYDDYSVGSTIANELASIIKTRPYLTKKDTPVDWERSLRFLHYFHDAKSREQPVNVNTKWTFDEFWEAVRIDMEQCWNPVTSDVT